MDINRFINSEKRTSSVSLISRKMMTRIANSFLLYNLAT